MELSPPPYLRAPIARDPRARRRAHDWVDERSRALHAAVATHLRQEPSLIHVAVAYLDRFEPAAAPGARGGLARWRQLLHELSPEALIAFLASPSDEATELRQSFPFLGILRPEEREAIFAHFETL